MFTSAEKTAIRRHCGYPAYGDGDAGFQNWRFYQVYGLMEFRLNNLSTDEETVVRTYLAQLLSLEIAIVRASDGLDTDQAAVWTRNKSELRDRQNLFDSWRRRLCGFLGLPPGPALGDGGLALIV
ncbi:MAG: hypothetical protein ACRDNS_06005 [Trebonia sp.]